VDAPSASEGESRYSEQANAIASGIDSTADVPGLKSVATATAAPASTRRRAGAGGAAIENDDAGSRTAIVPEPASASMPSSLTWFRWSALRAPSFTAASAAPEFPS
jgi:hypothetical protein